MVTNVFTPEPVEYRMADCGSGRCLESGALAIGVRLALGLAWLLVAWPVAAQAELPRFVGMLADGRRIEGERLSDWHDKNAQPRLDGQMLLEGHNPFRWLRDRGKPLADLPSAYVELHGGDRLPGGAIDYRSGEEAYFDPAPPYLVVRSAQGFEPPENRPVSEIRVALPSVRRIVWQRRGKLPYRPGTALLADGREVAYRAIRWSSGQVHLLLADASSQRIAWTDLAELHLPAADPWDATWDELAELATGPKSRLYQIETTSGLVATASLDRLAPRFEGNSSDPDRWVHGVQPAWSLDILWVPCREIVVRRSWSPHEVPLSRIAPRDVAVSSVRASIEQNRSSLGGPLRSQQHDFGWGLGVHGASRLVFDLPEGARGFRAQVCLDRTAGPGGCIAPRVWLGEPTGNPLWQSGPLVGSGQVADTGNLSLPKVETAAASKSAAANEAPRRALVLEIDPLAVSRPAGADPLDIRDHANWCDPLLVLDEAAVARELSARLAKRFAAFRGWTVASPPVASGAKPVPDVMLVRNERLAPPGSFHAAVRTESQPLVISRSLDVGPDDQWIVIAATRPPVGGKVPKLEVRIGGEPVAEYAVPERQHDRDENRPLAISLSPYRRDPPQTIDVEVRQLAEPDAAPVEYRAIEVVSQQPTLYCLFDEEGSFSPVEPPAGAAGTPASAALIDDDRHHGRRAVRVTSGGEVRLDLAEPIRIRERPAWGEYRFVRFAVRKLGRGQASLALETRDLREEPLRYDVGRGKPSFGGATRIYNDQPPEHWIVMTRDLFADFGSVDVTGLRLGSLGGEGALFDHVYLARGHHDLDQIPAAPSAALTNAAAQLESLKSVIERARPAVVRIEMEDGRTAAGTVISSAGEILTAGHFVAGPGRTARVFFDDGRALQAKTLGVSREFDLGLLRIEPPGDFPKLDLDAPDRLPQYELFLAIDAPRGEPGGDSSAPTSRAAVVALRRVFRSTVWTDLVRDDWMAGGPVLNREGRLIAVQSRVSQFGGVLATRFDEAHRHLDRLRQGEVFGSWPLGAEPELGCTGRAIPEGWEIATVSPQGPAATAGLAAGDVLVKLADQSTAGRADLAPLLAERDAGAELTIDYLRQGNASQARVKLAPRVP
jgi:S1-C subfamily serine protease